jgi:UDP-N-acetylglucosamine 4,6-dehydratase/5-epimerase
MPDLAGKTVLAVGATGSFGYALVRTLLDLPAHDALARILVLSRDELKQSQMRREFPDKRLDFLIGDVRDEARVRRACAARVDVVILAAAMKRIEACERDPWEAVQTNVLGAQNVVNAAIDCGIPRVLALSSDKACAPLGVYGASKLLLEKLVTQGNNYAGGRTKLSAVRYGNVMASRGSMIPLFAEQAAQTGTVTVTDERATRFLLPLLRNGYGAETPWTAVEFVLWALSVMRGGEVLIPKIPAARVVDVARAIAPTAKIVYTGLGPYEKLHESMLSADEARSTVDLGPAYALLPAWHDWTSDVGVTGARLPEGFTYSSDQAVMPVKWKVAV